MEIIIKQLIGAIGYGLLAFSYFKKEKREILFIQIISYIIFTIYYYLLEGVTGAICNFIGLIAFVVIYIFDKYKSKNKENMEKVLTIEKIIAMFFIIAVILINVFTFVNIYSIFPTIASVIVIISFITDNERAIREIGVMAAVCWLIYAIVYKAYIAIVFEVVTLIGVLVATIKNNKTVK